MDCFSLRIVAFVCVWIELTIYLQSKSVSKMLFKYLTSTSLVSVVGPWESFCDFVTVNVLGILIISNNRDIFFEIKAKHPLRL